MARSEEKEMVERICHPPSNPIISETTFKRRESDWENVTYKIIEAMLMIIFVGSSLLSLGCFFMAFQEPAGEKQQDMRLSACLFFGTAIGMLKAMAEVEETRRQNFQQGPEAGLSPNETPLIDIES